MKKILITILSLIAIILTPTGSVIGAGNTTYFGGKVKFTLNCTCDSGRVMVVIDDYASGSMIKLGYNRSQLRTLFFNNYSPTMGNYLLGSYGQGQACRIRILYYCLSITLDGDFNSQPGTGTS